MKLTPDECRSLQEQNAMRQQALNAQYSYIHAKTSSSASALGASNIGSTASTAVGTVTNTIWTSPLTQPNIYAQSIDRLEKLEPGWYYIRWRKSDDQPAEAWAVPIIALALVNGRVEYQLAGATVQAQSEVRSETFLGIITPKEAYDANTWNEKARVAYYEFHAAEVATALLRGMAQGAKMTP